MTILMPKVERKTAYEIIDAFHSTFESMNYPVISYRPGLLEYMDIDEGFQKTRIYFDGMTGNIVKKNV